MKDTRNRRAALMIPAVIALLAVLASVNSTALAQSTAAAQNGAGDQETQVLVNTLNEVLEENRKMRKQLSESQGSLEKLTEENSVLRNQIQRIKRKEAEGSEEDQQKLKTLQSDLEKLEKYVEELSGQNETLIRLNQEYEEKLPAIETKAQTLEGLLDQAVLEGERSEYLELIQSAQEMTNRTFVELAASKEYMLGLEKEMTEAYFRLGNMYYDMRDFQNAIQHYRKVLEINPNNTWVHHNLAVIFDYYVHDDKQAIYHYQQYLQLRPVEEEAHKIRERILELELKKNMTPKDPIQDEYFEQYTKVPR